MFTFEDWRAAPPDVVASLYDAECARWYGSLGWDYRPSCGLIEAARVSGRLPGLLARAATGEVVGWAYFLLHGEALQIGNLVTSEAAAAPGLLHEILCGADARRAQRLSCFLFPAIPAVERALGGARFSILRHAYLQRSLAPMEEGPALATTPTQGAPAADRASLGGSEYVLRPWSSHLVPDLVALLDAAYEGAHEARCFAPDGDIGQWATYVHQLVNTPACGRFDRTLSCVLEAGDGEMAGAILVTAISPRMAHIAQMTVRTGHRRRGVGEWMVRAACERARQARFEKMTLLVAESNERARRLYDRLGFEPSAEFVFADRMADSRQSIVDS